MKSKFSSKSLDFRENYASVEAILACIHSLPRRFQAMLVQLSTRNPRPSFGFNIPNGLDRRVAPIPPGPALVYLHFYPWIRAVSPIHFSMGQYTSPYISRLMRTTWSGLHTFCMGTYIFLWGEAPYILVWGHTFLHGGWRLGQRKRTQLFSLTSSSNRIPPPVPQHPWTPRTFCMRVWRGAGPAYIL